MKAKRTPRNMAFDLYERIVAVRRAELAMEELCRLPEYEDIFSCSGCLRPVLDNKHSLVIDDKHYHNHSCLYEDELIQEEGK